MNDKNIKDLLRKDGYVPKKPMDEWTKIENMIQVRPFAIKSILSNKIILGLALTSFMLFAIVPTLNLNNSKDISNEELVNYIYGDSYLSDTNESYDWINKDL